jgi:tetratricopeptide (TPR) repeat protein
MFFMRLRRGAKWAFIILIFFFAFGFLFSGVGGSGDIIQQLLGMRGGNATKSAEDEVKAHPQRLTAWTNLASLYERDGRHGDAVNAYEKALKVKPKDTGALANLAGIWQSIAALRFNRYAILQAKLESAQGPVGTGLFQPVLGADSNSLDTTYTSILTTKLFQAQASYMNAAKSWEDAYKRYAKVIPANTPVARAQVSYQLGVAAENAMDYKTAITSYKAAIKNYENALRLNPKDTYLKNAISSIKKELAAVQKAVGGG